MKIKLFLLKIIIWILTSGMFGLFIKLDIIVSYVIFKPIIKGDSQGWSFLLLLILPILQFIIITRLVSIGRIKIEWFDSKWVASRILK